MKYLFHKLVYPFPYYLFFILQGNSNAFVIYLPIIKKRSYKGKKY